MNRTEALFEKLAGQRGWEFRHKGLPDFICWRGDELMFVEVKRKEDTPTKDQCLVMYYLEKHGIPVYVWRPGDKFPGIEFSKVKKRYFNKERNWLEFLRS